MVYLFREVRNIINSNSDLLMMKNPDGEIPLHLACKYNSNENKQKVILLLQSRTEEQLEAENRIYGNTPLHVAASLGNDKIVDAIFEVGKNGDSTYLLGIQNKLKDTPVHCAAARGHQRYPQDIYALHTCKF